MSRSRRSEAAFESAIEEHLLCTGYVAVARASFDRERAIFPTVVIDFIRNTQPKTWTRLEALHGERSIPSPTPIPQTLKPAPDRRASATERPSPPTRYADPSGFQ